MSMVAEPEKKDEPSIVKPGLYKEIDFDTYAEWDAVNASTLNGFSRTPAHVYYDMLHGGKKQTPSLDLGWLVHLAVLEPERFEAEVVVPPKMDRRTKVGKGAWAQFQAEHSGKHFVDADTHLKAKAMSASVLKHPTAGEFFSGAGPSEISIVWEDAEHGLRCKARIDKVGTIGDWPVVADLKTTRNASRRSFERTIFEYGYHIQAAHYLSGLETLYPIPNGQPFRQFIFFTVESDAPHCVAAYQLDDIALEEGYSALRRYLSQWSECTSLGKWPGYADGVEYAGLPPWALKIWSE
jgi:exodeoxyribonuclease VIII